MAQNTRDWNDLLRLVEARIGHQLSPTDTTRVGWLLNSAASIAYNDTPWWERYLVLEPRTVSRGYINYTEDSYNVYGAGDPDSNGLYVRNGLSADGKPAYTKYDSDGTTALRSIWSDSSALWVITDHDIDATGLPLYDFPSTDDTPPSLGWIAFEGDSPAPIVQALSEIGEYIGHWNGEVFSCAGSTAGTAYPDQNGIRVTNCDSDDTVYVAFKKTLGADFGDGEQGTSTEVPAEWFDFMALHAARSWKASKGEQAIALADVQQAFDQALLKINRQGIYNSIGQRFRTYYGCDVSVR
jgi:hypothetical protein